MYEVRVHFDNGMETTFDNVTEFGRLIEGDIIYDYLFEFDDGHNVMINHERVLFYTATEV